MTSTIDSPTITLEKITGRLGAHIRGINPSGELSPATVAAIRSALNEHKALVFTDLTLDDAAQGRFAAHFGPLTTAHPTVASAPGAPNVLPVDSERGRANHWHTDVTFVLNPPATSIHAAVDHRHAVRRRDPHREYRRCLPRPAPGAALLR